MTGDGDLPKVASDKFDALGRNRSSAELAMLDSLPPHSSSGWDEDRPPRSGWRAGSQLQAPEFKEVRMSEQYSEHPVMFKNNPLGFVGALLLIPVFGVGLLILLWWHLGNKSSKLSINDNEILFEKGLLSKERSEVNLSSVRTIKIKQSFFNRIFGVGAIEIYTAGDDPEIVAKGMPDPNRVRELIKMQQVGNG